jgi:hypothetical protein
MFHIFSISLEIFLQKLWFKYSFKPVYGVTSIKQSPVSKGHLFHILSYKISYQLNFFLEVACLKLEAQHWAEPVSLTFHSALRKLNTEPSVGASHQISAHFGKAVSEKKIFRNRPI